MFIKKSHIVTTIMENVNFSDKVETYFSELGRWFVVFVYFVLIIKVKNKVLKYM